MSNPYQIVQTIRVTEKATELVDDHNKYTFKVARTANKQQIADAVEEIFNVTVAAVNVMNVRGKRKRLRYARYGKRPDWKKAVVTLAEGEIEII